MFTSAMDGWLTIVQDIGREQGWDGSLIFTFMMDDHTLVFQVRKSPLSFTIKQLPSDPHKFTVSYTVFPPGTPLDSTLRRLGTSQTRSSASVSKELEDWLRDSVAHYARETSLPD